MPLTANPNSQNPFRQELRELQLQHPLFQKTHPFWLDFFKGRLTRANMLDWGLDVYPYIRDFSRFYIRVASKCDCEKTLTFISETIFEETGSGIEKESHPTLFRNFLHALGANGELSDANMSSAGRAARDYAWEIVESGSFMEGLALVGIGIERPLPHFFQMISRALRKQFSLDETGTKFFDVHTTADVKHSQIAARIVSELADTTEKRARVKEILFRVWDLQTAQLNFLHCKIVSETEIAPGTS